MLILAALFVALLLGFGLLQFFLMTRRMPIRWLAILPCLPVLVYGLVLWKDSFTTGWGALESEMRLLFLALPAALGIVVGTLCGIIRNKKR